MELKNLSDKQLHSLTILAAETERLATTTLLHHLVEIQRRKIYAEYACSSLFDYCIKMLLMSEPQAARRVNAAKLLSECPQIEEKIKAGELSLTAVSQAQVYFRKEKALGVELNAGEKMELIERLESKSTREVEKILIAYSSEPAKAELIESVKPVAANFSEMKIGIDEQTLQNLERLKELWSHDLPNATYADVIKKATDFSLNTVDPLRKRTKNKTENPNKTVSVRLSDSKLSRDEQTCPTPTPTPAPELTKVARLQIQTQPVGKRRPQPHPRTRYISAPIKRHVWKRDQGECTYRTPNGQKCGSKHFVQIDHIKPFVRGGANSIENLRLLCATHNRHRFERDSVRRSTV